MGHEYRCRDLVTQAFLIVAIAGASVGDRWRLWMSEKPMGEFVGQGEPPTAWVEIMTQMDDCLIAVLHEPAVLDHVGTEDLVDAHVRRERFQVDRGLRRDSDGVKEPACE